MSDPVDGRRLPDGTSTEPAASDADKIAGILAQTRADYPGDDPGEIADRLRQRFEQSEIDVDDAELATLVERFRER